MRALLLLLLATPAVADTHAWFASVPRADWPCASFERFEAVERDDPPNYSRFHYGAVARCQIPIQLADAGIVGCPARITSGFRGKAWDVWRFAYRARRITWVDHPISAGPIAWDGGEPRTSDEYERKIEAGVIVWTTGSATSTRLAVDAKSRPLRAVNFDVLAKGNPQTGHTTFEWKGNRLLRMRSFDAQGKPSTTTELIYDCRKLPAEGPLANRGKDVGVDTSAR